MKRLFAIISLALWATGGMWAALTALHLHTHNQGIITLQLSDEPQLTFNDDNSITIETPKNPEVEPIQLYFDEIEKCEYGNVDDFTSGVSNIAADKHDNIKIRIDGTGVTFLNLNPGALVEVYDLNGRQALSSTSETETFTLDRSLLGHGIYIVRIGGFTTKLSL
ncbi:MAG: T9SS type A sorting domain-containing protein [Bacteroidales bacterium]|nr:T9SS type A sorting domain-containing protein [Bacteroidales bacterium]